MRFIRVDFRKPSDEPMLWVPDSIAGAVATVRRGDTTYAEMLQGFVEEFDITI